MKIGKEVMLGMYRTMVTIRNFEERMFQEVSSLPGFGAIHFSVGEEAVPTGVCAHLTAGDYLSSTHRPHGHSIAKGIDLKVMTAEILGRSTGVNRGKGGSMHLTDQSVGLLGANGIVCSSVPLACGAALKAKLDGADRVAVAFFGDGGSAQGVLYESMNLASVWKLPVVFVCENNLYANSTPVEYAIAGENIADRASGFAMPGLIADGMDVFSVYEKAGEAISRARNGQGPSLLECKTYRYYGHYFGDNPRQYRLEEEEIKWRSRDAIQSFRKRATQENLLALEVLDGIDKDVQGLVEEAFKFASDSPAPKPEELFANVYRNYPIEALKRGYTP